MFCSRLTAWLCGRVSAKGLGKSAELHSVIDVSTNVNKDVIESPSIVKTGANILSA